MVVRFLFALVLVGSVLGCGRGADFSTQFASDFAPAHHSVSVLGVYRDGRMSLDSWDVLAPRLRRALGSQTCQVGYDTLASSNQELANAIDEFARSEGPTGKLLTQVAPAALGDLILVLSFSGKLPAPRGDPGPPTGAPVANGMGTTRRRGRGQAAPQSNGQPDTNHLDLSASLFSVAQGRPVGIVAMKYRGDSIDDALTRFGQELASALPGLKCTGWNFNVTIDPSTIRPSMDVPAATHE